MIHLHQIFFLRWVLAVSCLTCVPKSFASTKACGDLFSPDQGSAAKLSSEDFVEFQKTAHDLFTATLTQASDRTPTEEKGIHFSKLAAFAKKHNLSPKDFEALREQSKMDFIRENFLETQSENKAIAIDPQKLKGLNPLAMEMKLDSMTDFYSSQDFIAELDKRKQISMYTGRIEDTLDNHMFSWRHLKVLKTLESIKNLDVYSFFLSRLEDPQNPILIKILTYPNNQNPNLRQVVFDYRSKSNEYIQLWTFQERVNSETKNQYDPDIWRVTHHMEIPYKNQPGTYMYFFPFYSAETNQIAIATFHGNIVNGLKASLSQFEWIYLDIPLDSKVESLIPHLSMKEQSIFFEKINRYIKNFSPTLSKILFSEKTPSFLFANMNDISNGNFEIELNHISSIDKKDFRYVDKVSMQYPEGKGSGYSTIPYIYFSEDGLFVRIWYRTLFIPNSPKGDIEDKDLQFTHYIFPIHSLQMQSRKTRSK